MWRSKARKRSAAARQQMRKDYGWLFDQVRQTLARFDPINIADVNPDEYEPEVGTILPRLGEAASAFDVQCIVHQEFVRWFSPQDAGPLDRYQGIAAEVWGRWLRFRAVQIASAILLGEAKPYEGARDIWRDVANPGMDDQELWDTLVTFVNDTTDWDDHVTSREELEASIIKGAQNVVSRWGSRGADRGK